MIRIAVLSDCPVAIVNALQSAGEVHTLADSHHADPALHDVLIVDWRAHAVLHSALSEHPRSDVPCVAIVGAEQNIPDSLNTLHITDIVCMHDIQSAAFRWRLSQLCQRYQFPPTIGVAPGPENTLMNVLVDHLSDWVIMKDLDHRFLLVSDAFAETVGLPKSKIIGRNDLEIGTDREAVLGNPSTGWPGFWAQDDAVIESGTASSEENTDWRAFSTDRRYKRTTRTPLRNSKGEIFALLVVAIDITDRVLAERNLQSRNQMLRRVTEEKLNAEQHRQIAEQAVRAKNKFLAAASHDLRQPLHALGLFLAVLERRLTDEENLELLQKVRHSSEALSALFNSLLDISRLDAGVVEVTRQTFSIRDLLISIRDEFVQLGQSKSLTVTVEMSNSYVYTDPVLFGRILRNLLQNAITHTSKGSVSVRCRESMEHLEIAINDSGPGIPESQHEAIFSEFYQLNNSHSQSTKGLGLGLAIVQKMAALLDTDIQLTSEVNKGSCFTVAVPLGKSEDVVHAKQSVQYQHLAGHKILLIDDEPDIRQGLTLILNAFHCQTVSAESAAEALTLLEQQHVEPDIMIVDYQLQQGNTGSAAIHQIRQYFNRDIPAIIVTGDTSDDRLREAKQTGFRLLHKPVDIGELATAITHTLEQHTQAAPC